MVRLYKGILFILFFSLFSYIFRETNIFKVNKVEIFTQKLSSSDNLRILQISDMHNKRAWWIHKRLLQQVHVLSPDIIVLTGDLVDRKTKSFKKVLRFIDMLRQTNIPIYFVTGNHEWGNAKHDELLAGLKRRDVTILDNRHVELPLESSTVTLVGIHNTSTDHEDVEKAFQYVDENTYTILLSHSPYVITKYPEVDADLIISGHTHGGQIRFPFFGAIISPGGGMFPELDKGLIRWKKDKLIYIDSGLGTSMIPVRFLNQSQISLIEINRENRGLS